MCEEQVKYQLLHELEKAYTLQRAEQNKKNISVTGDLEKALLSEFGNLGNAIEGLAKKLVLEGRQKEAIDVHNRTPTRYVKTIQRITSQSGNVPEFIQEGLQELSDQERDIFTGIYFECKTLVDLALKYGNTRKDILSTAKHAYVTVISNSKEFDKKTFKISLFRQNSDKELLGNSTQ